MATQAITGYNASLEVSTNGGTTYTRVGELRDITLHVEADKIDASSKDSAGWREFLLGMKSWSGTAGGLFVDADVAQDALYAALENGTKVKLRFRPQAATSGKKQWVGDAMIMSYEIGDPMDDAVAVTIEFTGSGALARSTQP
jgi:TP901-1 family phage major tail protein